MWGGVEHYVLPQEYCTRGSCGAGCSSVLPLTRVLRCLRSARFWNFCQLCECVCSVLQWKVLYNVKIIFYFVMKKPTKNKEMLNRADSLAFWKVTLLLPNMATDGHVCKFIHYAAISWQRMMGCLSLCEWDELRFLWWHFNMISFSEVTLYLTLIIFTYSAHNPVAKVGSF